MKTVAFIPIKMNNERVPGKNVKPFSDGTPLIHMIMNAVMGAEEVDEVYVCCSNERIKEFMLPGTKFLKRDVKYDASNANVNEMHLSFAQAVDADIYLLAHATSPFLSSASIDEGIKAIKTGKYDSALTVMKQQDFMWKNGKPFNFSLEHIPRTQDLEPFYLETTGMFAFTRDVIYNKKSRTGDKPYMIEVNSIEAIDIDWPIDFDIADAVYMQIIKRQTK